MSQNSSRCGLGSHGLNIVIINHCLQWLVCQLLIRIVMLYYHLRLYLKPHHIYASLDAERFGHAYPQRPIGSLVWLHMASLGEFHGIKPLILHMQRVRPDINLLLTTFSPHSAAFLKANLPQGCQHVMLPFDQVSLVRKFIQHWQPQAVIWAESEFWPNTIKQINHHGLPLTLVNARLSVDSSRRWRWLSPFVSRLLDNFGQIFTVDQATYDTVLSFGYPSARLQLTGSLKCYAEPLPADTFELAQLRQQIACRQVWLAASTHVGEEKIILAAHCQLRASRPDALLIMCPRQPHQGKIITELAKQAGLIATRRSQAESLQAKTGVYIADTLGELGLWYRLVDIAFLGGSLTLVGGHNPHEAIALKSLVMHGPEVANFADSYAQLKAEGLAFEVASAKDISTRLLSGPWPVIWLDKKEISTNTLDDIMTAAINGTK